MTLQAQVDAAYAKEPGSWHGHLFAEVDGRLTRLAPIAVSFEPAESARIVGAADGKLTVSTNTPALGAVFELEAGALDVHDVTVEIDPLHSPTNRVVVVDDTQIPHEQDLAPNGRLTVPLIATLAEEGAYNGAITVRSGARILATADLVATRTKGQPDVELDTAVRVKDVVNVSKDGKATFTVNVENTSGIPLDLAQPTLRDFARVDGDDAQDANESTPTILMLDPTGVRKPQRVTGRITLTPDVTTQFRFTVEHVDDAGIYQGTVKFREPGGTSRDTAVTVLARRPRPVLILLTLLGGLALGVARFMLARRRKRLQKQRQLARLEWALATTRERTPDDDDTIDQLFGRLQDQLNDVGANLDADDVDIADEFTQAFNAKLALLPPWIEVHLAITDIEAKGRPDVGQLRSDLGASADRIVDATDKSALTGERDAIADIDRRLDEAIKQDLTSLTAALRTLVDRDADPGTSLLPTAADRDEVRSLRTDLDAAAAAVSVGDLEKARVAYEAARSRYTATLLRNVRTVMESRPAWFDEQSWQRLQERITPMLEPAAGRTTDQQLADANKEILATSVVEVTDVVKRRYDAWKAQADRDDVTDSENPMIPVTERQPGGAYHELTELYTKTVPVLRVAMDAGRYGEAGETLKQVTTQLSQIPEEPTMSRSAVRTTGGQIVVPTDVPPSASVPERTPIPPSTQARANLKRINTTLFWLDVAVVLVALAVSLLIANFVLYNDTWGTAKDLIAAVLWGLGIQLGANYTYGGLLKLADDLTGTAPPPA